MKFPRFLSTRFVSVLALGATLSALAPLARAQDRMMSVPLTMDKVEKISSVARAAAADPAIKAEFDSMNKSDGASSLMSSGGNVNNDAFAAKFPKVTAAMKSAGMTPDEFVKSAMSLMLASMAANTNAKITTDDNSADAKTLRANIEFVKANKARIDALNTVTK